LLSIITATYNSPELLKRAVNSVLAQSSPDWQLVISPDDGRDYSHFEYLDERIKVVKSSKIGTGPGAARNRGLERASGDFLTSLDDDDYLPQNFVDRALAALKFHETIAFITRYVTPSGIEIRVVGNNLTSMTISQFALELGSMHVVALAARFPSWHNSFAEDVFHTCESIDLSGGSIPIISESCYFATVRPDSFCATLSNIDAEYSRLLDSLIWKGSEKGRVDTINLFRLRKRINSMFESAAFGVDYNTFVKDISYANRERILLEVSMS
jgi:glycosyltransferase involved in cell wall biosynthesis